MLYQAWHWQRSDLAKPSGLKRGRQRQRHSRTKLSQFSGGGGQATQLSPPQQVQVERGRKEGRAGTASCWHWLTMLAPSPIPGRHPRSPMTVSASCSLRKSKWRWGFSETLPSFLIQLQKSRDRRPSRVCSKTETIYFLIRKHISASYCLILSQSSYNYSICFIIPLPTCAYKIPNLKIIYSSLLSYFQPLYC